MFPYRRFDCVLAGTAARLGADVVRYFLHRGGLSPLTPRRFYPGAPYLLANLPLGPEGPARRGIRNAVKVCKLFGKNPSEIVRKLDGKNN